MNTFTHSVEARAAVTLLIATDKSKKNCIFEHLQTQLFITVGNRSCPMGKEYVGVWKVLLFSTLLEVLLANRYLEKTSKLAVS